MGEMADYALEQVCEMEFKREEFARGDMSTEDAYDLGLIDEQCIEQEGMERAWDQVAKETFNGEEEFLKAQLDLQASEYGINKRSVTVVKPTTSAMKKLDSEAKTLSFLRGFANHYYKYGELSPKQEAIIATNWKGGVEGFLKDCSEYDMVKFLDESIGRICRLLQEIRRQL